LLFFRRGDFDELFNEDVESGADLLGIALTERGTTPMAGIPDHAATLCINRRLNRGYTVGIYNQTCVPKPGHLVKGSLVRILSPGTILSERQLDAKQNRYILAIGVEKMNSPWRDLKHQRENCKSQCHAIHGNCCPLLLQ
jgi:DNA mismatch repair protein MutS